MAKDFKGQYLHIDDLVTFNEFTRPKKLIGCHGRVASVAEKTVMIIPMPLSSRTIEKQQRINPSMLTKGLQRIHDPYISSPYAQRVVIDALSKYFGDFAHEAMYREIISEEQARRLNDFFIQYHKNVLRDNVP